MATYFITATNYQNGSIALYQILHPAGNRTWVPPQEVARLWAQGNDFATAREQHGRLVRGAEVQVVIRTHPNASSLDNIENLPRWT